MLAVAILEPSGAILGFAGGVEATGPSSLRAAENVAPLFTYPKTLPYPYGRPLPLGCVKRFDSAQPLWANGFIILSHHSLPPVAAGPHMAAPLISRPGLL